MLILTRRIGETLDITVPADADASKIQVSVLGVKGNQVRIGVNAPRAVVIDREEITARKAAENGETVPKAHIPKITVKKTRTPKDWRYGDEPFINSENSGNA